MSNTTKTEGGASQGQPTVRGLPNDTPMYELLRLQRVNDASQGSWVYETVLTGYTLFSRPAIFGGVSLGAGLHAAMSSLYDELGEERAAELAPYSYQGSFLGPALAQHAIRIQVTPVRTTRSFVTRCITLSQEQTDPRAGANALPQWRKTLIAIVDFAKRGRKPLLEFDAPCLNPITHQPWERPDELELYSTQIARRVAAAEKGTDKAELALARGLASFMSRWDTFVQYKMPPDSLTTQSAWAFKTDVPTTQDAVPLTDRAMVDWVRFVDDYSPAGIKSMTARRPECVPFRDGVTQWVCLSFLLDQIIPAAPLVITKTPRSAAATDVSLDFSIRFHQEDTPNLAQWCLRQFKVLTARAGRTFNQITVWDEQGRVLATISQQGHLVPAAEAAPKPRL